MHLLLQRLLQLSAFLLKFLANLIKHIKVNLEPTLVNTCKTYSHLIRQVNCTHQVRILWCIQFSILCISQLLCGLKVCHKILSQFIKRNLTSLVTLLEIFLEGVLFLCVQLMSFSTCLKRQWLLHPTLQYILCKHSVKDRTIILKPRLPKPKQIMHSIVTDKHSGFIKKHLHTLTVVMPTHMLLVVKGKGQTHALVRKHPHLNQRVFRLERVQVEFAPSLSRIVFNVKS